MKPPSRAHRAAYVMLIRPLWRSETAPAREAAVRATVDFLSEVVAQGRGQGSIMRDLRKRFGWKPNLNQVLEICYRRSIERMMTTKNPFLALVERQAEARP